MIEILRWGLAILLGGFGAWVAGCNWICGLGFVRSSWVPLFGGGCGVLALWAAPVEGSMAWWWVPLVADFGCVVGFAWTGWYFLREALRRK